MNTNQNAPTGAKNCPRCSGKLTGDTMRVWCTGTYCDYEIDWPPVMDKKISPEILAIVQRVIEEEEEEETPDPIEAEEPPRAVCPVCENANDEDNMTIVRGVYVCDDCTDYFHRMLKREEEAYAAGETALYNRVYDAAAPYTDPVECALAMVQELNKFRAERKDTTKEAGA